MAVWSEILCSEVDHRRRMDAEYYQTHFLRLQRKLDRMLQDQQAVLLRDIANVEYGYMPMQDYADESGGEPLLRVTNLKANLEVDDTDVVYIPRSVAVGAKKRLQAGDVLLVQCGDTTGKVGYIGPEHDGMIFPSFCLRIRSNGTFPTEGLALFLGSTVGQMQIAQRVTIATVRPNTCKPDVETLVVPKFFGKDKLAASIAEMDRRRKESKRHYRAAEALLESSLGLDKVDLMPRSSYERPYADVQIAGRFDAEYYQPPKKAVLDALAKMPGQPVSDQYRSIRQLWQPDRAGANEQVRNYDLTDALQPFLDEKVEPATRDTIASTKKRLKAGDLVVSRLRSYLKEIAVVLETGAIPMVGSTEFIVLRPQKGAIRVEALLVYLRSKYVQTVLKWCQDGSNHPRFDEKELLGLCVPNVVRQHQDEIAGEVQASIGTRREARQLLDDAKAVVEQAVLGGMAADKRPQSPGDTR